MVLIARERAIILGKKKKKEIKRETTDWFGFLFVACVIVYE